MSSAQRLALVLVVAVALATGWQYAAGQAKPEMKAGGPYQLTIPDRGSAHILDTTTGQLFGLITDPEGKKKWYVYPPIPKSPLEQPAEPEKPGN